MALLVDPPPGFLHRRSRKRLAGAEDPDAPLPLKKGGGLIAFSITGRTQILYRLKHTTLFPM